MKYLSILCMSFAFAISASGQDTGTVSGRLTFVNNNPVSLTIVLRTNGREIRRTTSDTNGDYKLENIGVGTYQISVLRDALQVAPGGEEREISIVAGSAVKADFTLNFFWSTGQPSPSIRETVAVAIGESQPVEQVSKTVDVIGGQEMRERADFALIETLRTIPGFRIQQSGGFGRLATVKTRGLRNQDTAVLIDGIRFRDPTAIGGDASPLLSDLTLTSVSEIEVLRGSGSSVWGTNAIGGVIDFQTPTAQRGTHGQVAGAFGGLGLGRFRGLISHGWDKFGIGAGVSRTVYTDGIDGDDDARNTNFQTRLDARPFANTSISGRTFFSDASVKLNVNPDTRGTLPSSTSTIIDARPGVNFVPDANDPDSLQRSRFFSGQATVKQIINNDLVIGGYYHGLSTRRENTDGLLGPGFQSAFTSLFEGNIHTVSGNLHWTRGRNSLTAGYEFEREQFRNDSTFSADVSSNRADQRSNTFYLQDLVSLAAGNLQLAGGFRLQAFDLDTPTFLGTPPAVLLQTATSPPSARTFDGAISYFIERSGTKLRAHVGNGYRVPSLYERFSSYVFFGTVFPLGNPRLKPEHSIGLDGGIEQNFADQKVKLSATYFYTRVKDEIAFLPTDNFSESAYYNFDRHYSRGAEFSVRVKPKDCFDFFASYTFTNSDIRAHARPTFPVGPVFSVDRKSFGIPDHQFTLVVTQRYRGFWINADFLATSSFLAQVFSNTAFQNYTYRFAGNRRADATAGYGFNFGRNRFGMRIYGTVENVFDNEYYENGFRTIGRTARIGMTFSF